MAIFIITVGEKGGFKQEIEISGLPKALEVLALLVATVKRNNNHPAAYPGYWAHLKSKSHVAMSWEDHSHYARIQKKGQ